MQRRQPTLDLAAVYRDTVKGCLGRALPTPAVPISHAVQHDFDVPQQASSETLCGVADALVAAYSDESSAPGREGLAAHVVCHALLPRFAAWCRGEQEDGEDAGGRLLWSDYGHEELAGQSAELYELLSAPSLSGWTQASCDALEANLVTRGGLLMDLGLVLIDEDEHECLEACAPMAGTATGATEVLPPPPAPPPPPPPPRVGAACSVRVSAEDSVTAAQRLAADCDARAPPAVLCYSSPNIPGGAVASGVAAQEEDIFRRTSICLSLPPHNTPKGLYPMGASRPGRCVVAANVCIVKDARFEWLFPPRRAEHPWPIITVISCPAPQKPPVTTDGEGYADDGKRMRLQMTAVLQAAVLAGSRVLVLGAWGCGGFRNPPAGVANAFRCLLFGSGEDEGFERYFDHVEFAVPDARYRAVFEESFRDYVSE